MVRLQTGTAMAENDNLRDRERRLTREEELAREREKLRTGAWMNLAVAMVTVGIFTPGVTLVMGMTTATMPAEDIAAVMGGCVIFSLYLYCRALAALNRGHK